MAQGKRPNILVIMSDEHDPAVMGCYGDGIVETPNLDRLAREGVTFDAAYTTSPLCVPARLSFTAGKYISRISAWANSNRLEPEDMPTLPRLLNDLGYESWLGGKMHYDVTRGYGFRDLFPEVRIRVYNGNSKTGRNGRMAPDEATKATYSWDDRSSDFGVGDSSEVLDPDRIVTRECSRFLRERKADDAPFFLLAGYLSPHFPLTVPEEFYDKYKGRVPMPNIPEGLLESLPTNYKMTRRGFGCENPDAETVRLGRECYWALTDWFDREVGKLLDALGDSEVADNTIVIYTSDHGENKGDHGLWWKNCMYEHAARVPLIVRWPDKWKAGERRAQVCSLVDVVQTIADMAGAETPDDWDGDSLLPVVEDGDAPWKDFALSEYYAHNIASGFTMFREGDWKYVYHCRINDEHGAERELFDLADDPEELHNLAYDVDHRDRVRAMHAAMVAELGRDPEEIEAQARKEGAQGYAEAAGMKNEK